MALDPGMILGAFEITGLLGKGGMGEVYAARDRKLGRDVAIKVLPEYFAADAERLARFEREAQTLAALNHPNVATVYGFEHDEKRGLHYLVMEHIDGETLGEVIFAGPLLVPTLLPIFIDIARGLDAAHEAGIVHRDLKPDNVKINASGVVKILDFGLAKGNLKTQPSDPDAPTTPMNPVAVTAEGTFLGTPSYMSPEQARGKDVDRRTDIWAFGCCLYQALTGDVPFKGDTIADTVGAILERDPDWHTLPENTPREIRSLLRRCLEKDPRKRFSSAGDMAYILEEYREHLRQEVHRPSLIQPPPRRKAWLPLAAGIVLAIAGIGAALWAIQRSNQMPAPGVINERPAVTSLAVLPLENLMKDPEQDYFTDGMTDALIGELGKISSLDKVISRTTAMQYRDTDKSMRQIADELGVQGIIEGSVLRENDRVSIRLRLFEASTEHQVWQHDYEENVESVLKLNGDIALAVASAIDAKLSGAEQTRLTSHETVVPAAYDAFLRGKAAYFKLTDEGFAEATRWFDEAVRHDPQFASAYAWSAMSVYARTSWSTGNTRAAIEKLKSAAIEALRLNDESAVAHSAMAMVAAVYDHDWQSAMQHARRVLQIAPQEAGAHNDLGTLLLNIGRIPEGVQEVQRAVELDPTNPLFVGNLAEAYVITLRLDDALEVCETWRARHGDTSYILSEEAGALFAKGEFERVLETLAIREQLDGFRNQNTFQLTVEALSALGREDEANRVLAEFLERYGNDPQSQVRFGDLYFALGQLDEGFKRLDQAYEQRVDEMVWLQRSDYPEAVYDDPRYWDLVERMNFPPLPLDHPLYAKEQKWKIKRAAKQMLAKQGLDGSPRIESLAVLPLRDLSPQGEQDYFAESMTEAITAELAKIKALKIRGRASAMQYKDTDLQIPEIAKALNVDALIEGSVTRESNNVRIDVTLQHGATDSQLWTFSDTKTITSILQLQSEVALAIADAVNTEITRDERERIATTREVDPKAHEAYILGQHFFRQKTLEGLTKTIAQCEEAVRIDPKFVEAWTHMGNANLAIPGWGLGPATQYIPAARTALDRAIEVDDDSPEADSLLAVIDYSYDYAWPSAETRFKRAIRLSPNSASVRSDYAWYLSAVGRLAEALDQANIALDLDPDDPLNVRDCAAVFTFCGQSQRARSLLEGLLDQHPDDIPALDSLEVAYQNLGMFSEAVEIEQRRVKASNRNSASLINLAGGLALAGQQAQAEETLDAGLRDGEYTDKALLGYTYVCLGKLDEAFDAFERGYKQRDWIMVWLKGLPYRDFAVDNHNFRKFREDDRFWELCERMNFPTFPPDHPGYADEQWWMAKKAAKKMLAEQETATTKPVRRYSINLPPEAPITTGNVLFGGVRPFLALSPDGTLLVYVAETGDSIHLYRRRLDSYTVEPIPGTEGGYDPFFSPDGKWIGFIADDHVKKVLASGGAPIALCPITNAAGAVWAENGDIYFADQEGLRLSRIHEDGEGLEELERSKWSPDIYSEFQLPSMVPQGGGVFVHVSNGSEGYGIDSRIAVRPLDGSPSIPINQRGKMVRYLSTGHLLFAKIDGLVAAPFDLKSMKVTGTPAVVLHDVRRDGKAVFALSQEGTLVYQPGNEETKVRPVWVSTDGEIEDTSVPTDYYGTFDLSPDGTRLAIEVYGVTNNIYIVDLEQGTRTKLTETGNNKSPVWLPDGERVLFQSIRGGQSGLYTKRADRVAEAEPFIAPDGQYSPDDWTSDGETIAAELGTFGASTDIQLLSRSGEVLRHFENPYNEWGAAFSPDDKWIAYTSTRSGTYQIYGRRNAPDAPADDRVWQISNAFGEEPLWTPEGDAIVYRSKTKWFRVPVSGESDLVAGTPELEFEGPYLNVDGISWRAHPTERKYLVLMSGNRAENATELRVIENFDELVKQRAPLPEAN
jgi:serine/threonine protein kinase/tetratricopeptide (TPR) repeat protein/WD40 repeat protein